MSQSDPIADCLTQIRNASRARLEKTDVPDSRINRAILDVLKREGFIQNVRVLEATPPPAGPPKAGGPSVQPAGPPAGGGATPRARLRVYLKYTRERRPVLSGLKRISRPGRRRYVGVEAIPSVLRGIGISVVSTPKGVLTDAEAKAQRVGGELLCQVW